jgi:hypothetical protein
MSRTTHRRKQIPRALIGRFGPRSQQTNFLAHNARIASFALFQQRADRHLSLSFNNLHSNLSIARATKMDDSIDNLLFQFDDALFDDATFNEFNCPLPQDGPDLIQGSPDALDEAINKLLGLEGSPSGSCLSLINLTVTDIGFMQIQRLPAPRGHPPHQ